MSILDDLAGADSLGAYYEEAIDRLARQRAVASLDVAGRRWVEIDFVSDYADALRQFGDAEGAATLAAMPSIHRQLLFCPGPVLVSKRVKRALAAPEIGHREVVQAPRPRRQRGGSRHRQGGPTRGASGARHHGSTDG